MKELTYYEFCDKHGLEKTANEAVKKSWLKHNELCRELGNHKNKQNQERKYYDVCNDYSLEACEEPKDLKQCNCLVKPGSKNIRYYNKDGELWYFSTPGSVGDLSGLDVSGCN